MKYCIYYGTQLKDGAAFSGNVVRKQLIRILKQQLIPETEQPNQKHT